MPGGKPARDKGLRGEHDIVHRLGPGAKRVGVAYAVTPVDVLYADWGAFQVKNHTIGGAKIAQCLAEIAVVAPTLHHFVAFKYKGKWFIAETLEQCIGDHIGMVKEEM